jgi:hypothetical protein
MNQHHVIVFTIGSIALVGFLIFEDYFMKFGSCIARAICCSFCFEDPYAHMLSDDLYKEVDFN